MLGAGREAASRRLLLFLGNRRPRGVPVPLPKPRTRVYVDGLNFYYAAFRRSRFERFKWLDVSAPAVPHCRATTWSSSATHRASRSVARQSGTTCAAGRVPVGVAVPSRARHPLRAVRGGVLSCTGSSSPRRAGHARPSYGCLRRRAQTSTWRRTSSSTASPAGTKWRSWSRTMRTCSSLSALSARSSGCPSVS